MPSFPLEKQEMVSCCARRLVQRVRVQVILYRGAGPGGKGGGAREVCSISDYRAKRVGFMFNCVAVSAAPVSSGKHVFLRFRSQRCVEGRRSRPLLVVRGRRALPAVNKVLTYSPQLLLCESV